MLVALVLYAALDVIYFGGPLSDLGHSCVCGPGSDPETYMWFLSWWPHALLHGHNPFLTDTLFAPHHLNIGALVLVPAAAIVMAPVTLLFGPLVSYNLVALAAPLLAALSAFALCRYITGRLLASLVAGYVFGFSPYMLGHMMGHLDLLLVFPIPLVVLVSLRYLDGVISRRRAMGELVAVMAALYLSQPELTLTGVIVGALALALAIAIDRERRPALIDLARTIVISGLIAVALVSVFIYYALTGDISTPFFATFRHLGADALGFAIPTDVVRLGRAWFSPVANQFQGGLPETGVYVGVPILLILIRWCATRWDKAVTKVLIALVALVALLSLGAKARIAGQETLPLPWGPISHLPLMNRAIPLRLGVFLFLIVAVIVALWLTDSRSPRRQRWKWLAALAGLALLLPNLGPGFWSSRPVNPSFFTGDAYRRVLKPGETVLTIPWGTNGDAMLWQAETGFYYRQPGAYIGALLPLDYVTDPLLPALSNQAVSPPPAVLQGFLVRRHVGAVVLARSQAGLWPAALGALGMRPVTDHGVLLYRVPPALTPGVAGTPAGRSPSPSGR
jgi:hypothetical protein